MLMVRLPSHFPVRATEWMLAAMKLSWGFVLLLPMDTFNGAGTALLFSSMKQIASETTWGCVAFIAGLLHLAALYVNGTQRRSPHLRATCSGVGVLFWFQVCIGLFSSGIVSTGWAMYPWCVVFSLYNVVRAMQDAALSDQRARGAGGNG